MNIKEANKEINMNTGIRAATVIIMAMSATVVVFTLLIII
jgi:hypothetical protein